jgi:hypothetical protein
MPRSDRYWVAGRGLGELVSRDGLRFSVTASYIRFECFRIFRNQSAHTRDGVKVALYP